MRTRLLKNRQMEHLNKSSRENLFAILILSITGIMLFLAFYQWAYDDPFISYRYAENLTRGLGFVYNPGERILSTTTPLFTTILAVVGLIIPKFHLMATTIGIISLGLGGLFIFDLGRTYDAPIVGWVGLLLYPTFPLLVSTIGSETPVYLAFCLGAYAFYARKNYLLAGFFGVLGTLTRPDGILVLGILSIDYLIRYRHPIPWKPILLSSAILIGWLAFSWIYFGSLIPVTLAAKQQQGLLSASESFSTGLVSVANRYNSWPYVLGLILAIGGVIFALWQKRDWLTIIIWPVVYFISYALLGVTRYFWYYAPLIPGIVAAIGLGVSMISNTINMFIGNRIIIRRLSLIVPGFLIGSLLVANGLQLQQLSSRQDPRLGIYKAVGDWLRENTSPGERVASLEVGILGFYAQRPMVDFAGLIQPKIAEQFSEETTFQDAAFFAVEEFQPEYLVLHDGMFSHFEHVYVNNNCVKLKRFRGKSYAYDFNLTVFDCR
jgi:hypothetical protein